jgi:hypothetical protein
VLENDSEATKKSGKCKHAVKRAEDKKTKEQNCK